MGRFASAEDGPGRVRRWTPRLRRVRGRLALGSVIAVLAGSLGLVTLTSEAQGATTPPGFGETIVFSGLRTHRRPILAGRPGVRRRKARRDQGLRLATNSTPDVFADLNVNVHNFWDRGLLGMALDPGFPANPYVYVLYAYDQTRIGIAGSPLGHAGGLLRPLPDTAGSDERRVCSERTAVQADGEREHDDGQRAGAGRGLVPAVPQPLGRECRVRALGGPVRQRRRRRQLQLRRLGPGRAPLNPCGDPPGRCRATFSPPTAEGGALRSQDLRTSGDPVSSTER